MKRLWPPRSLLYVPASNERALAKAGGLPCDAVIVDLEDSVAPEQKSSARASAVRSIEAMAEGRQRILRINALDTQWCADDVAAASCPALDALLLPKPGKAQDIETLNSMLDNAGVPSTLAIWLMIETAAGFLNLASMLAASSLRPLGALVLGLNDLAKETRIAPGEARANLRSFMLQGVLAARAHGLDIFDGVFNAFQDIDGFKREARQAAALGFDGKTLIHPSQIEAANEAFSPAEAEIARARRIVEAFDLPANQGRGVISLDGEMVELLHREQAQRLLARWG